MVRPGHRTHDPLPARAILPRDPACRTAQPEGTRGRYECGLVSQTPPHLQRHTRRCTATFLAGTGFCHVSPSRRGEETPLSAPGRHYLCALPHCLMAKVELRAPDKTSAVVGKSKAYGQSEGVLKGAFNQWPSFDIRVGAREATSTTPFASNRLLRNRPPGNRCECRRTHALAQSGRPPP